MSISGNGERLAIRNYLSAHLFERTADDGKLPTWKQTFANSKPRSVPMPLQVQGEAICFTRDNDHVIVTSETVRQPIWKVRITKKQKHDDAPVENPALTNATEKPTTPLKTTEAQ